MITTYELTFKHRVCQEYLRGNVSKSELQRRYGIKGKSAILKWLRQLGYLSSENKICHNPLTLSKNKKTESAQLKAIKKELEDSKLKLEAYQRMIAIAEEKFKIEIEKKSDTK